MSAITCCRACGSADFVDVLDLGATPLANALRTEDELNEPEQTYPLKLVFCPNCSLVQITENVDPEVLFSHYFYRSSFSDAFLSHCKNVAEQMVSKCELGADSLVIDIASNDGYLLQFYKEKQIPVLGIEPAQNIAKIAVEAGIPTEAVFFTEEVAADLANQGKQADVIHANNVMPHVADQRDFAAGIKALLKPSGTAVIEFAYLGDTLDHTEFDQIYHEHMCYFSLTAFKHLCEQAGLSVQSVERLPVHGGSLRVSLHHSDVCQADSSVTELLGEETGWGCSTIDPYQKFAEQTAKLKDELMTLLVDLRQQDKRIAVYGASAKGSTLMNYFGIGNDLVEYIVDRSTLKQGHYAPGTNLKIEPTEKLLKDQPDYVLLLTWNFANEIMEQQHEYREAGGKFIVPIPAVSVV